MEAGLEDLGDWAQLVGPGVKQMCVYNFYYLGELEFLLLEMDE